MNEQPALSPTASALTVTGSHAAVAVPRSVPWRARARGLSVATVRALATPACLLGLCLLSVAFFYRALVLHQALLPADILYAKDPLWHALAPPGWHAPLNGLDSDNLTEFYPWTALAASALRRGVIPLWNPYAFAGAPFLAAMQTGVFYPVNLLLEWLLAPTDVLGARAAVHLALALVGAFLFARRLALSRPAALLVAVSFGLGLPYMVWLEHPMGGAVAWLPWLLLCVERILAADATGRGRLRWTLGATVVLALEFLSGHGESSAHILLFAGAYAVFGAALAGRRGGGAGAALRPLLLLVAALALGLGVAAAHLLPSLAQIPGSEAAADRALGAAAAPVPLLGDPAAWTSVLVGLAPDVFGNPTWQTPVPGGAGYNELALYVGAVPLLLAAIALLRARVLPRDDGRRATLLFFAVAALVALGVAARWPGLGLVNDLPLLRVMANGRLRMEYALAVAIVAGYGLDALTAHGRENGVWRLAHLWLALIAVLCAVGMAALLASDHALPIATAWRVLVPALWLLPFAGLLWLYRRHAAPLALVRWGALALSALDLFVLGWGYHATVPASQVGLTPPAIAAVLHAEQGNAAPDANGPYRVAGLGKALLPSLSGLYGLQDVRGYDPAYSAAYERFFAAAFGDGGMRLALGAYGPSAPAARALNLLDVRYLFAACNVRLNARYYVPLYSGGDGGCVYRNPAALPRAFVVHDAAWATPARATSLLIAGSVDPRDRVLLDPATATDGTAWSANGGNQGNQGGPGAAQSDGVAVTSYDLNNVEVTVRSAAPGVLVIGDAYAPGWHATVDGQPAPIARADAILRAVPIPAGTHLVELSYLPTPFLIGGAISIISLIILVLLLLVALWRVVAARPAAPLVAGDWHRWSNAPPSQWPASSGGSSKL